MTTHKLLLAPGTLLALALASGVAPACSQPADDAGKPATAGKTGAREPVDTDRKAEVRPPTPPAPVPFSLALRAASVAGFPGLHSAAGAMHEGSLVLMAGRRNGLHVFPPERKAAQIQAFPRTEANETIYVIDPASGTLRGSAAIDKLPEAFQAHLRATNTQSIVENGWLYIVGGYSYAGKSMKTLDTITAVELGPLVDAIVAGKPLDRAFAAAHLAQASHLALAITGGELVELGGKFLLVFGNQFDGLYTPGESVAVQTYSESVRAFSLGIDRASGAPRLSVDFAGSDPEVGVQQDPDGPYHRRDGVVEPAIDPMTGNPRIAAYGGVFKGGRMEGYTTPIYIDSASDKPLGFSITEDKGAMQLLSHYDCAAIQVYDGAASVMYTTLFGGISQFYWDAGAGELKRDPVDLGKLIDGLPFIDSVSTLRVSRTATGSQTAQYLHEGQSFPPADARPKCVGADDSAVDATLLGAETEFFLAPGVPMFDNEVLRLDQIRAPTVIGYFVGGIASTAPYSANGVTCASNLIYTLTLTPDVPSKTVELKAP